MSANDRMRFVPCPACGLPVGASPYKCWSRNVTLRTALRQAVANHFRRRHPGIGVRARSFACDDAVVGL